MLPEDSKKLVRRLVDAINAGNWSGLDELFAPNYLDRTPFLGSTPNLSGAKQILTQLRAAFPDFRYTIEDGIYADDKIVSRVTAQGTQKGEFMGSPATGKSATWTEIHINRVVDGKFVEHWGIADQYTMLQQLGLAPAVKVPAAVK
jgi:predicted ester cyclase